jgi:tRNA(Ile)-lysidine synthase
MTELDARLRAAVVSGRLLNRGDHVLVGVSGGPDSVALLHLLAELRGSLGFRLSIVHVDHQLRPDSGEDARFVQQLAASLGLNAAVISRRVELQGRHRGLSLEDAARRIRYDAFLDAARRLQAGRLALAHTADDQAETVIMRMIRGAGPAGLSAIPLIRSLGELTVIRPLLHVSRHDVLAYLRQRRLAFRQDPSNADPRFLRNRIRSELLPMLERAYNPQIRGQLRQLADQCRAETAFLQQTALRYWKRLAKCRDGQVVIRLRGFLRLPTVLQQHLFRLVIQRIQGDLAGFEFRHWLEIEELATARPLNSIVDLPGELQCVRERDELIFRSQTRTNSSARVLCFILSGLLTWFQAIPPAAAARFSVFKETYTRQSGAPVTESDTFSVLSPNGSPWILRATNGDLEDTSVEKVSSSTLQINGIEILKPDQFNQDVSLIEMPVNLSSSNTIAIQVRGKPGGQLIVEITGVVSSF